MDEIDERFAELEVEKDPGRRFEIASKILRSLDHPESSSDDRLMADAIGRLFALSVAGDAEDAAILAALDNAPIDGGFGVEICSGYRRLMGFAALRRRYLESLSLRARLGLCVGMSFSESELRP